LVTSSVTWSIEETVGAGTSINDIGLLTVAAGESAATLTVKATSTVDTTKSGTATVTLVPAGSTIINVQVSPNGSPSMDTGYIDLYFSGGSAGSGDYASVDIPGLAASDITIAAGSTGTTRGALTSETSTGHYKLTVSGVTTTGEITVTVTKSGFFFNNLLSATVTVYKAGSVPPPVVTPDPTAAAALKTTLVSAGITGATVSGAVVTIPASATLDLGTLPEDDRWIDVKSGVTLTIPAGVTLTGKVASNDPTGYLRLRGGSALTVAGTLSVEPGFLQAAGSSGAGAVAISGSGTIQLSAAATSSSDVPYLLEIANGNAVTLTDTTLQGIDANYDSAVYITSSSSLTMAGSSKITGNTNVPNGGAAVSLGSGSSLTMKDHALIEGNSGIGSSDSGGVYVGNGAFTMQGNASVKNNSAAGFGGGVNVGNNGTFTMEGSSSVTGNTAESGGGVRSSGAFVMKDTALVGGLTALEGNTAANGYGGGVYITSNGAFTMSGDALVQFNTSPAGSGGGVYIGSSGAFTMNDDALVTRNTAASYGGGLYAAGDVTINGGGISENTTSSYGGGVYFNFDSGTFTLNDGFIDGNTADYYGGGVYIANGDFVMADGSIGNNKALKGGGVYLSQGSGVTSTLRINGGEIAGNYASSSGYGSNGGGGVFISSGDLIFAGGSIRSNEAGYNKGSAASPEYRDEGNSLRIDYRTTGAGLNSGGYAPDGTAKYGDGSDITLTNPDESGSDPLVKGSKFYVDSDMTGR
jgi:predicted outer membrane repeat protein